MWPRVSTHDVFVALLYRRHFMHISSEFMSATRLTVGVYKDSARALFSSCNQLSTLSDENQPPPSVLPLTSLSFTTPFH